MEGKLGGGGGAGKGRGALAALVDGRLHARPIDAVEIAIDAVAFVGDELELTGLQAALALAAAHLAARGLGAACLA
jgi:hypothetical protein